MVEEGDSFLYHHCIGNVLSAVARKLLALLKLFYESHQGFVQLIHPHHEDDVLLNVNIIDCPVIPEEIIHHLQIRDLNKPH